MNESSSARSESYNRLRAEFDTLAVEDKAIFLLESTLTTLVRGIEAFGRTIGDELERVFRAVDEAVDEAEAEAAAEAAADAPLGTPAPNVTPEPPDDIPGPRSTGFTPDDGDGPIL